MKRYCADLHIHTALSPCASDDMTPAAIVEAALRCGLDMIGICDHNSAGNVEAVQHAAAGRLSVVAGMELTTAEEIHLLGLFPDARSALEAAREVRLTLPDNSPVRKRFGRQLLMDASDRITGEETKMLSAATTFTLHQAVGLIKRYAGLALAAHVNRPSYSVFSQLGLFPTDVQFDAIELADVRREPPWQAAISSLNLPAVRSSDSHDLSEIGKARTFLDLAAPTFPELSDAFSGIGSRAISHA